MRSTPTNRPGDGSVDLHFRPGTLLRGFSKPLTFALIRCTLFLDGFAPRYHRPPSGKGGSQV